MTCPLSMSSRSSPRRSRPTLSPASAWSSSFLNISTPVPTVFLGSRMPTISTSSPTFVMPPSTRPVATVPRPLMAITSSIRRRKGLSLLRRGAGDHVLDVVGVTRAVDVRVMALVGLVLDMRDRDGDAALALLGGVVDRVERAELRLTLQRQGLGDSRGERGLTVVDVTDGPHVHMRLGALELLLGHRSLSLLVEPTSGIEPETSSLPRTCSTN